MPGRRTDRDQPRGINATSGILGAVAEPIEPGRNPALPSRAMPPRRAAAALALASIVLGVGAASVARAHGRSVSYSSWALDETGADVSLRVPLLELSRLGPQWLTPERFDWNDAEARGDASPGDPMEASAAERGGMRDTAATDPLAAKLASELTLTRDGEPCPSAAPIRRFVEQAGWVRFAWRVECASSTGELAIESRVLLDVAPSHLHFARVRADRVGAQDGNGAIREQVLTEAAPRFVVRARDASSGAPVGGGRFRDYVALGVHHILSGWDHVAFLLGLVLLASRLGEIARLVTGFTLAHSLTLALTVQGLLHPRTDAVEAVIAFSVALVAAERGWHVAGRGPAIPLAALTLLAGLGAASALGRAALPLASVVGLMLFTACHFAWSARRDSAWTRTALTFGFGLVHGFGFAGVLVELDLPRERLVPALAGFNLGVELGQIAIVLLLWPALALAARVLPATTRLLGGDLATAALCGLGCFWLYARALALP